MTESTRQIALQRLKNAPWRCKTTDKTTQLLETPVAETDLRRALNSPEQCHEALEACCALRTNSHHTYQAVCRLIQDNPLACWCLVDSLNRLPWYSGIRAFLNHPDPAHASDCTISFYILARNRVFFPTDMCGSVYEYYVKGLWILLKTARHNQWESLHPAGLAVLQLMHAHLERPRPDHFVVYLAALLLGGLTSQANVRRVLRLRRQQRCHSLIAQTAALVLEQMPQGRDQNRMEAAYCA